MTARTDSITSQTTTRSNTKKIDRKLHRKRLPLNCGECRKKKLSCDRVLPCHRCIRSGRPEKCSFDTESGKPSGVNPQFGNERVQKHDDDIRALQRQIAELRGLVTSRQSQFESSVVQDSVVESYPMSARFPVVDAGTKVVHESSPEAAVVQDPRGRRPRGYYTQHSLFQFFSEIPQLWPFVKDTTDEFIKPLGIHINKPKRQTSSTVLLQEKNFNNLIPCKADTDTLVSHYIDNLSNIHHIIHIPTFQREYTNLWTSNQPHHQAMSILVLSILSISVCLINTDSTPLSATYRNKPPQWISTCEDWIRHQSSKHHKLIHYQILCLIHIGKRVNMINKKAWWRESGSLVQSAVMDGLHIEQLGDGVYMREMKRRIWLTVREIDLQSAFEFGLPSLLCSTEDNVASTNLDDGEFDELTKEMPAVRELGVYNSGSFQVYSSQSWNLRLDICRRLFSGSGITYEAVLRYTHQLTQCIHALPSCETEPRAKDKKQAILTNAFLQFQLQTCILALHRPYLGRDAKYWISENTIYLISRDMLLLNTKLSKYGLQNLALLREDFMLAALTLTRVTLSQSKDSTNLLSSNSQETISLLGECLPFAEDRYLRCSANEPWCYITLCSAIMLLKVHAGSETRQPAQATCAQKFLDLHYRHIGRQRTCILQNQGTRDDVVAEDHGVGSEMDVNYADICEDPFDLDIDLGGWEPWGAAWSTLPLG